MTTFSGWVGRVPYCGTIQETAEYPPDGEARATSILCIKRGMESVRQTDARNTEYVHKC